MSFDKRAKKWDTKRRKERVAQIAKKMKDYMDLENTEKAMEFGCGTGLISFKFKDYFDKITLLDSSKGMIDVVKEKIENSSIENMKAVHMEGFSKKFMQKRFDVIYTSMVMHHIPDTMETLKDLYKLLENNGTICIVDLDTEDGSFHSPESNFNGHFGFDQDELKKKLESIGYKDVKSETFFNGERERDGEIIKYSMFIMTAKK